MATNGITQNSVLIPFSSRLKEGRALAQDVWSIFKYALAPHALSKILIHFMFHAVLRTFLRIV